MGAAGQLPLTEGQHEDALESLSLWLISALLTGFRCSGCSPKPRRQMPRSMTAVARCQLRPFCRMAQVYMRIAREWPRWKSGEIRIRRMHRHISQARLLLRGRTIDDLDAEESEDEDEDEDDDDDEDIDDDEDDSDDHPQHLHVTFPNLAALDTFTAQVSALAQHFGIKAAEETERIAAVIARIRHLLRRRHLRVWVLQPLQNRA